MKIERFPTLDSTMLEARRNPAPGRIIVADQQTAGMGSHGRAWHSPAAEGLYVSIVLGIRPTPIVTLALGLAAREAIGAQADLRWPNDVLLRERKCAGILAQAEGDAVIAGIGINVSQSSFPDGLDTPATSLALEGIAISREDLLLRLVAAVDRFVALPPEEILRQFERASSYVHGKRVRAGARVGVTCGLDASGFLRLREDNGTETMILAGGVRPI
jgi:BirA family transcriptional regulator, biotin operon repressor / biotin---[acetyl-CoA-carboxylase] ligase